MKKQLFATVASGLLLAVAAAPSLAQWAPQRIPGTPDPAAVKAATYDVDPNHTQVWFSLSHLGFSLYSGGFSNISGTLRIDPRALASTSVDITVPVSSVHTTSERLDGELKSDQWLDATAHPTMRFQSTRVTRTGANTADIAGNLTLHGVTRPLVLKARLVGAGFNFLDKTDTVGFQATGVVNRSEFGVRNFAPLVGENVDLTINAAFTKKP